MGLRITEFKNKNWVNIKDRMPKKVGIYKVKIDDGSIYDSMCVRKLSQEFTFQPWDELVEYWLDEATE